ncbi:MAG: TnpV protein [Clostridiales bacterium]|nr:TnpV protein [Clostridiales bacterium]
MKSLYERMGGTYTLAGDGMYSSLLLTGKLTAHLKEIDDTAHERMDLLISHYLPVGAALIPVAFLVPAFCFFEE